MGKPSKDPERAVSRMGKWMAAQTSNTDDTRRDAAVHICSRWNPTDPWFSFAKVIRTLRREDSEYLTGALELADDYVTQFGVEGSIKDLGAVGPFVPYEITKCTMCRREAVPGSDRCGRHGGQFISAEDAKRISQYTTARVLQATSAAVRVLEELMDEARSEMVRLQAATAILDRAGVGPSSKVELDVTTGGRTAADELRLQLEEMAKSMHKVEQIESGDVVDAEVVEGDAD